MRRATVAEADALCPWLPAAREAWLPRPEHTRPLVVRAWLSSPLVRQRRGEHALDALLGYAVVARAAGELPSDAMAHVPRDLHVDIPVPIADDLETGVACASWPRMERAREGLARYVRKPEVEQLGAKRVLVAGGSGKPTRDDTPLIVAAWLEWDVVGDAERIEALLADCIALGARRASGHGKLLHRATVRAADADRSLVRDGSPARPVPIRGDEDARYPGGWVLAEMATRAPYWHRATRTLCAVPPC